MDCLSNFITQSYNRAYNNFISVLLPSVPSVLILCVLCRIVLPCNLVFNTTKGLIKLIISFFIFLERLIWPDFSDKW